MTAKILAAYYTNGTKTFAPTLRFATIENGACTFTHQMMVKGKAEARKVAVAAGYTPWNF